MSPLAERAYSILKSSDWMSAKRFADAMGVNDRTLRGSQSILDRINHDLMEAHGLVIIRRTGNPSGVKLTNDAAEIRSAARQLFAHLQSERRSAEKLARYAESIDQLTTGQQLTLPGIFKSL